MKFRNINRVYRQTAPDAEGHGGGGSAPETATEEPASELDDGEADHVPSEDESLWEQLSRDDDDDSLEEESSTPPETPEKPPAKPEEETPAESPAEEPEPEPEKPEEPEKPAEQPPEETPEETKPEPPQSEEDAAKAMQEAKDAMQARILEHYKLSDEDALRLVTDPKSFMELQARMWTDMFYGMKQMFEAEMPRYIESGMKEVEERNEYVDQFFQAWPKLDRNNADHRKTVAQVAKTYGQLNPNASDEEVVRFVGMQTMLMHGIAPEMAPVTPEGTPPPTPPATPAPAAPVKPQPGYEPSAVNGAGAPQPSSDNIWTEMAEQLLEDDSI